MPEELPITIKENTAVLVDRMPNPAFEVRVPVGRFRQRLPRCVIVHAADV